MEIVKNKKYFCNGDFTHYRNIQEIKNNKISFCRYGGGFVQTINLNNENFLNSIRDKKIIFTNKPPKEEYKYGKIYIDCYGNYPKNFVWGYIEKNRFWNGWSIVVMTLEGIKKHNELIKKGEIEYELFEPTFKIIDDDTIVLIDPEEEGGKVTIKSHEIIFKGKKIKVFDPMSMGWCWQEITKK
tara:strand:- start:4271 stop:4822 length:552 start_codon:yes stop_codon:yes gene_type:complete